MQAVRKHSKKRDAILEVLRSTKSHPSAQWVYERVKPAIPDLSLGTVYRNLAQFQQDGLVMQVGVVAGEQRFDANTSPHPHLVCECCHSVIDLPLEAGVPQERALIESEGHALLPSKSVFYGVCRDCVRKRGSSGAVQ